MPILFLDDDPDRAWEFVEAHPGAVWVETVEECIPLLTEQWDEIWLDHDLGGEVFVDSDREDCGMEVARYIAHAQPEHLKQTHFVIHSHNWSAGLEMCKALCLAGYECSCESFGLG